MSKSKKNTEATPAALAALSKPKKSNGSKGRQPGAVGKAAQAVRATLDANVVRIGKDGQPVKSGGQQVTVVGLTSKWTDDDGVEHVVADLIRGNDKGKALKRLVKDWINGTTNPKTGEVTYAGHDGFDIDSITEDEDVIVKKG